jgi:adenylate cyclase
MAEERAKRKLSAILSADVKGYSRLMGEDEVGTVRTLKDYRELMSQVIKEYRGRVVDSPGDNLLAEFASVVDAVESAVEIQHQLKTKNAQLPEKRRMEFRIGINLGDVIEEGERIYGEGVNVAARLESLADSGGICISGIVYDQIKKKLNFEYRSLGKKRVKNIEEPVDVYQVVSGQGTQTQNVIKANVERMAFPLPEKPSIAVLPFTNMSGDSTQDYLGDGLSENIITALSAGSGMFVIARNSTFTYKGRPVRVQQVAEELGVRYVLEGSIQKSGDRLRVTAQLIDALNGHHLWSQKYDRRMGELFDLQDEITKRIVVSLQVKLTHGEQARAYAKSTENLEAWSYGIRGNCLLDKFCKEDNATARELLETAIKLDPNYVLAYVWLGATYALAANYGWSGSPADSWKRAYELADKALSLDDNSASVHALLSMIYLFLNQHDKAISEGEVSISLDPNFSIGHAMLAQARFFSGQFQEAIQTMQKAMRLSPYYPAFYLISLGRSYAFVERHEEAIAAFSQLHARGQRGEFAADLGLTHLARVYAEMGQENEAKSFITAALNINPNLSLESLKLGQPFRNPAHMVRELEALRKAGLK